MKIIISGYGRMGRIIEKAAERRGHAIIATIDPIASDSSEKSLSKEILKEVDVVIDFSIPRTALKNAEAVCSAGKKNSNGHNRMVLRYGQDESPYGQK